MRDEPIKDDIETKVPELRQDPRKTNSFALMWLFEIVLEFLAPFLLALVFIYLIWAFS